MPYRYASRASAINQMYLRATIMRAIKELAPATLPTAYDVEHLRSSPFYASSMYVGPFVTYNVETPEGDVLYDIPHD